ncbi:MAG: alpha-L-rhamnosidase [Pseudonocardiales bacterium]|nr:alpha-L-rhamnosidase [Pseudonocardiales bacterium]
MLRIALALSVAFTGVALASGQPVAAVAFDGSVSDLRVEAVTAPLGVAVPNPRLSWQTSYVAPGTGQIAAHIQVATSETNLASGTLVWDSGFVDTAASAMRYAGAALVSGERYFWHVQVRSSQRLLSVWSATAMWGQGLMSEADWRGAQWISPAAVADPAPQFRHAFTVDPGKTVEWATASVAGLGLNAVYVNGLRIDSNEYDAAPTDYRKRVLYTQHALTVQPGANVIGIALGSGWYHPELDDARHSATAPWVAIRKLRALVTIRYTDGSTSYETSAGGTTWMYGTGSTQFDSPLAGETIDTGKRTWGWAQPSYSVPSDWQPAVPATAPAGALVAQIMPAMRAAETLQPTSVVAPAGTTKTWVYSFAYNVSGGVNIELPAGVPAGTQVTVDYDESLTSGGTVAKILNGQSTARWQHDIFVTDPRTTLLERSRFTTKGFRYVQISGLGVQPKSVVAYNVHTDVATTGSFTSSSGFLNALHAADARTYLTNLLGIPVDCPQRERRGWLADAALASGNGLLNFDSQSVYEAFTDTMLDQVQPDGSLPSYVPSPGITDPQDPWWGGAILLIPWNVYRYTGDTTLLSRSYAAMKGYVEYLKSLDTTNYRPPAPFGDWLALQSTFTGKLGTSALFLYATILSKTAELIGNTGDQITYNNLASDVRTKFNAAYWSPSTHKYTNPSVTMLSLALALGLVPDGESAAVDAQLLDQIATQGTHLVTGIIGTKYLFQALTMYGHDDIAYRLVTDPTLGYSKMLSAAEGGTIWESWTGLDAQQAHVLSRNHPALSSVEEWLYTAVGGIRLLPQDLSGNWRADAPIQIAPTPVGGLTSASASTQVRGGMVSTSWSAQPNGFSLDLTVPDNRTATVSLPGMSYSVTVNGAAVASTYTGGRTTLVAPLGSGTYHIQAAIVQQLG